MGLEIDIDGSGSIGDISPGWSVQEYATPIIPGDVSGGTGLVSFSGEAHQDSLFLVNTTVTSSNVDFTESRRNLCVNPSFESDLYGWTIGSNVSAVKSTAQAYVGTSSMLITKSTLTSTNAGVSVSIPTMLGKQYTISAYIRNSSGDAHPYVFIGGASSDPILVTTNWVRHSLTVSAGSDVTVMGINSGTATVDGSSFHVDAILIEEADSDGTYFDGSTSGSSFLRNTWQGLAGQSESIQLVGSGLGEVSGVVKSVSQTGGTVSVTHGTSLAIFDANFDIPALGAGGMLPVIDIASQLSGRDKLCIPSSGQVYSMCGHSAGFNSAGVLVKPEYRKGSYPAYNNSSGQFYTAYFSEQYGSIWADSFAVDGGQVYATNVVGDCFSNIASINVSRLAFKAKINSGLTWHFMALPDDSNTGTGQEISLTVDTSGNAELAGWYRYGGSQYDFLSTSDLSSSFDINEELVFFIEYRYPPVASFVTEDYEITVKVCGNGSYDSPVIMSQTFTAHRSQYIEPWTIVGKVRDIYSDRGYDLEDWVAAEYAGVPTYVYSSAIELDGPVPAQVAANLWTYMQDACTVYEKEIAAIDGDVVIRDIDTLELDASNHTPITITPSIILSGRNVEINYSNARHVSNAELYNAYKDDNRVISVKAAETIKTIVTVDGTIASIVLPTYSSTLVSGPGKYKISDSKGNPVPIDLWNDNGGRLEVNLIDGQPNAIEIVFTGPTTSDGTFDGETPEYPGPYKLAYTADGTDYAAISIIGTGILTTQKTLKLRTAADPDKTAQDVAKTISNPFIIGKTQAYDRGLLASIDASGPKVTISGTVSVDDVTGFGFTAGSRIRYMDSIYRVSEVNYGSLGVSFTAVRHVKVSDFDSFWADRNVGTHDLLWDGYDASDHTIKPLWFIGDDESVVLMLDTDGNPYFAFTGIPEISVLFDTDGNPYYVDGPDDNGEPVYLDMDSVPYYQGQ